MGSFLFFAILLSVGLIFGQINEANHFKELDRREKGLEIVATTNVKKLPSGFEHSEFVSGNVVISIDYFKRIAAGFRIFFGGQIRSYTSLVERARREAVLRMKEEAYANGYSFVANVRIETSSVFQNARTGTGSLEVYAYGTALK